MKNEVIHEHKVLELYDSGYGIISISKYFGYSDLRHLIKKY